MLDLERLVGYGIYLDTNIFIYAIESGNRWTENLRDMFEAIDDRAIRATTSDITLAEVLMKRIAAGVDDLVAIDDDLLKPGSLIEILPVDR